MLFNSIAFLFLFLPISLAVFFCLGRRDGYHAKTALALLSFLFYAYWDCRYLPLLLVSISVNFYTGGQIALAAQRGGRVRARRLVIAGILFNLALLGFFKYANLLSASAHTLFGLPELLPQIVLPIGISFFTFTQIAFLVDAAQGKAQAGRFWDYALFVAYFPHQIAGPILHHQEMMDQFRRVDRTRLDSHTLVPGLSVLACGLIKKVLLADSLAEIANPVFASAGQAGPLTLVEAWAGVMAYALQLYFDFSAYCDMAIGVSLMFGIRLPANFNSPYQATSIIDFWQRWHITLSRFLRDYLYIPLGGNRKGRQRRYANLLATMALGGLWHGASWTFLVWGLLHGVYLAVNHLWREQVQFRPTGSGAIAWRVACWALTMTAVVVAWVFFRADTFHAALALLSAMAGWHGISLPEGMQGVAGWLPQVAFSPAWLGSVQGTPALVLILLGLLICLTLPNTQQLFARYRPVLPDQREPIATLQHPRTGWALAWRPSLAWALPLAVVSGVAISRLGNASQFLYFNF